MANTQNGEGSVISYRDEVYQFLHTVCIKFDYFSLVLSQDYMLSKGYGSDQIHEDWNYYYRNICGEYTDRDSPMYIFSVEEQKEVMLTREYLETHPATKALYRIPNEEYYTLCKRYPSQSGLIKSIVYPAKDVNTVISAQEFEILHCDASLLYEGERESLVTALREFLEMVRDRWWQPEYQYENLYATAFWMLLWQSLPNVLMSQRILNIGTEAVHPFHLWEYLKSKGLNDYRDILSPTQAFWLYRNMTWIEKNKGKHDTLIELEKNILHEVNTELGGVIIKPDTTDTTETCKPTPSIVVTDIPDDDKLDEFGPGTLIEKLEQEDLIDPLDPEQTTDEIDKWISPEDDLVTKYIILVKQTVNTRYENLLIEFMYDTLMYRYHLGDLYFKVKITDSITGSTHSLDVGDAIALLYYALHMQYPETEVHYLPNSVSTRIPYRRERVRREEITRSFQMIGYTYYIDNYVRSTDLLDRIPYHEGAFTEFKEYLTWELDQFECLLADVRSTIGSGWTLYQESMCYLYGTLLVKQEFLPIYFRDPNITTYNELRALSPELDTILTIYDTNSANRSKYIGLADAVLTALFPLASTSVSQLVGVTDHMEELYDALKELFIKLCSYNVCFLETERTESDQIELPTHTLHSGKGVATGAPIIYPITTWVDIVAHGFKTMDVNIANSTARMDGGVGYGVCEVPVGITSNIDGCNRHGTITVPTGINIKLDLGD